MHTEEAFTVMYYSTSLTVNQAVANGGWMNGE